ncbi:MAG: tetratricopeptide repeat protein [Myxococcota bacterium]|nr:tetratricopeptide repeat protein [Myxococcota bacterium]
MHHTRTALVLASALVAACANPDKRTLAELHRVEADTSEIQVVNGLDRAMSGYRRFLEEAPESALTPEAMRRLADLNLEKEFGILGGEPAAAVQPPAELASLEESEQGPAAISPFVLDDALAFALPDGRDVSEAGPLEAIELYDRILATYPYYEHNDRVLYQKARAYDELGRPDEAIAVAAQLIAAYPHSRHIDEVQFRRAEYFFTRRRYFDAEEAYAAIAARGAISDFYELALYKLGWTLYKQELHEEALDQYVALLDHKVSTGYDFDQSEDEDASRRITDTFRVVSLSFSSIGGPEVVEAYFTANGPRLYEDRVYRQLGEFYLDKLRYQDAASSYEAFVALHPEHRSAPHFGMRVVEIYEAGGFPLLVLSSKKAFAASYGLGADYWEHVPIEEAPEVLAYLKGNLRDLANHYHAAYQDPAQAEQKSVSFGEAEHWYRGFLTSFPEDGEAPVIHQQLADLLLENEDFGQAAREYEHTAYHYPAHDQAADAGYAAIYAHRSHQEHVSDEEHEGVRQAAVASTLRFVAAFPAHQHAASVLGAAVDDLFEMAQFEPAIDTGRRLLDAYPEADPAIRRSAWLAIGHSAFELDDYPQAENAYTRVLEMTAGDDESRPAVVENLAASIYQQGEQASEAEDHRSAADHFLRIAELAPGSTIRASAVYDAGAALIHLEDWDAAVEVLNGFREAHPDHALHGEATKQLAQVYRKQGDLERAAVEYERIAAEADDEEQRREALLAAGELYEDAGVPERAITVYLGYVERYPAPLELAVETRFKIATLRDATGDRASQREQLRRIVELDRTADAERTPRIRYLAARSSLVLTEVLYDRFAEIELAQPFEASLAQKQQRMDAALAGFGELVDYEVGEVTAAATYYMAEIYREFSRSLLESERPVDLSKAELLDYEGVLEEEAFPFEEKAIAVHEKNLELARADVYNRWIEKSLAELAELMPGRYAKFEASSGPIHSLNRYAYQAPTAVLAAEPTGGTVVPLDPAAAEFQSEPDGEAAPEAQPPAQPAPS